MHVLNASVAASTVALLVLSGGLAHTAPADRLVQQNLPTQGPNTAPDVQDQENDPNPTQTTPTQSPTTAPTQLNNNNLSDFDRQFMVRAAQSGMAEVQLGQLAVQRAASNEVRQFGQRMIQDHTRANAQLMQLSRQKGVSLPQTLGPQYQAIQARLSNLSGTSFDRAYMNQMVQQHSQDVSLFQQETQRGQDTQVRAWARQTLPALQAHLQQARTIANNLQPAGADAPGTTVQPGTTQPGTVQTEPVPALW
jgi:putative membrane protein